MAATTCGNPQAALRDVRREEHESHEEQALAEKGKAHVDGAGAPRGGRAIIGHQPEGREADQCVEKEKSGQVRR